MRIRNIFKFKRQPFAWLLIWRQKYRSIAGIMGIAFLSILILFQLGFNDSLMESSAGILKSLNCDLILVHSDTVSVTNLGSFSDSRRTSLDYIPGVEETVPLRWTYAKWKLSGQNKPRLAMVLGIDLTTQSLRGIGMSQRSTEALFFPETILFDKKSRPEFGNVANLLRQQHDLVGFINNNRVHVNGLVEIGPSFGYDGILVTSKETYESVLGNDHYYADPTKVELGLIRVADGFKVEEVAQSIIPQLPPDVRLFTKQGLINYEKDYWNSSKPIGYVFGFGIAMGFAVGTIILYQILFTDIISNIEYYGVMLAIGYPLTYLRGIVASQAFIMSILSFPLALSISSAGYTLLAAFTGLPFRMSIDKILGTYGLVLAMSILSAMLAIFHLKSTNPANVFK